MEEIRRVLSYNDILLVPRYSGLEHLTDANIEVVGAPPIINSPMDTVCSPQMISFLDSKKCFTTIHRWFKLVSDQIKFYESCTVRNKGLHVYIAVGTLAKWRQWIEELLDYRTKERQSFGILVDVANGDTKNSIETVEFLSRLGLPVMAGNVATKSGFSRLQDAGATLIRVGIGGGSICSTRLNTGFGVPTLTSIFDCAKVKDSADLIADGGIESPGDICKAMAAGADFVMLGKMLAATSLSGGEKLGDNGRFTHVRYSGMASKESIEKLEGPKTARSIEGVSGLIPYTGTTEEVFNNICGNLRSSMAYYAGARNWHEFRRHVKLIEISQQGWEESKTRVL